MIIQKLVCDLCNAGPGRGPSRVKQIDAVATRVITIDKKSIAVDVCQPHDDGLTAALAPFVAVGRRVQVKARVPKEPRPEPPAPEVFTCTCGRTFETQRGLTRHVNHPPVSSDEQHDYLAAA